METIAMMNPFVVGRYVSDKYFCDREGETSFLIKQIENGRNVALISPRRLGKTGLIQHLFHQESIEKNYHAFFVDIYATTSLTEFVYLLGKAIYDELKPKKTVWTERFFQIITSLRAGFKLDMVTGEPCFDIGLGDIQAPQTTLDELAALIERFHTTEPADVACMERSLRKILNRDSRFAIQTVSGLLLVRCEEIFLFQFLGDQRCWQIVLTSRTTHKLKMGTTAKDLLSINNTFVQISQDCIVNLTYLMFIENKTLRCEFYPPFQEEERIASHRYFKQLRERLDII